MFKDGLDILEQKLSQRHYTSVAAFSADLTTVILPVLTRLDGLQSDGSIRDITDIHEQLNGVLPGTAQHLALTQEQKELKRVTKRIAKAVKEMIDAARKKEAEMKDIPFEKEMGEWAAFDARLESSVKPKSLSSLPIDNDIKLSGGASVSAAGGASPSPRNDSAATNEDVEMTDAVDATLTSGAVDTSLAATVQAALLAGDSSIFRRKASNSAHPLSPPMSTASAAQNLRNTYAASAAGESLLEATQPVPSIEDPWARGGVPWYLGAFDIAGTTVHEERWTGLETMRAMSEPLSEIDDETLLDLEQSNGAAEEGEENNTTAATSRPRRSTRGSAPTEPDEEETEEAKAAREHRDKVNARRRAQRRRAW